MYHRRTHYEVLGLPETACTAEIQSRFHELARQHHPDRAGDRSQAERMFGEINVAYRTLVDPGKRANYDATQLAIHRSRLMRLGSTNENAHSNEQPLSSGDDSVVDVGTVVRQINAAILSGQYGIAESMCRRALTIDPENADIHQVIGDLHAAQRHLSEALAAYKVCRRLGASDWQLEAKIARLDALASSGCAQYGLPSSDRGDAEQNGHCARRVKFGFLRKYRSF